MSPGSPIMGHPSEIEVSIIVPCRNERRFIGRCIDSILSGDYPKDRLEILIVDGMSDDGTREIVANYCDRLPFVRLIDNPQKIVSYAMNTGIRSSRGKIVIRMDAHTIYPAEYVSKCVGYLVEYDADNVGGVCVTLPGSGTSISKSISLALSHRFGVGNSYFRVGTKKPRYVDTVPFGCYKREVFERIGLFDEQLVRNQDDELNFRLLRSGGKILLAPDLVSQYYARDTIAKVWRMYFQYGYFKPLVNLKVGGILTWRQLVPPLFVATLIVLGLLSLFSEVFRIAFIVEGGLYLMANFCLSTLISLRTCLRCIFSLPFVFAVLHFGYGLGYLTGIVDFSLLKRHRAGKIRNVSLTR